MALAPGARLGPYEVVGPLGAGGMGEVYRARDTRLGRDVAIKVIGARAETSPTAAARFEREWRVVARLSHPNILALHDIGEHDGFRFAVTELVPGETLRQRLTNGPLPIRKAVELAIQLARGLGAAHAAGVVHRDLKPENVIVTPDALLKILDFGLARPQMSEHDSTAIGDVTEAGTVLGTRGYMAPEQARGEAADQRADVFAFGAVLYEMLTGVRAFSGPTSADVLHAVIGAEPDAAPLARTPPAIRRIVQQCLEKRREERFSSAQDVAYALEAAVESQSDRGAPPQDGRWTPRPGVLFPVVAALALAVAIAIGWQLTRANRDASSSTNSPTLMRAQLAGPPGSLTDFKFSPDGRRVAAIATQAGGTLGVWVRELAGLEWRRIASTTVRWDSSWCQWSPDSRSLVYPSMADGSARLRIVDITSGVERTLERNPFTEADPPDSLAMIRADAAWSAESGLILGGPRLRLVSPDSGEAKDLLVRDSAVTTQRWPSFLPDGVSYVFTQFSVDPAKRGVFLGRVGAANTMRLSDSIGNAQVVEPGALIVAQGGAVTIQPFDLQTRNITGRSHVVASSLPQASTGYTWFSVAPGGALATPGAVGVLPHSTIHLFDRHGVLQRGVSEADRYVEFAASPDGRRLAVLSERPTPDIVDVQLATRTPLTRAVAGKSYGSLAWLDARSVLATQYTADEHRNLILIDTASGASRLLLETQVAYWPQAFAAASREIIAIKWEPDGTSLWALSVERPENRRRLSREGAYVIANAAVSPDGTWLAFDSNETGASEVYLQPLDGSSERRRVSPGGGLVPSWSPDGRELYYVEEDGTLTAIPMKGAEFGSPLKLFKLLSRVMAGRRQYAVLPGGSVAAIVPIEASAEPPVAIVSGWTALLTGEPAEHR